MLGSYIKGTYKLAVKNIWKVWAVAKWPVRWFV